AVVDEEQSGIVAAHQDPTRVLQVRLDGGPRPGAERDHTLARPLALADEELALEIQIARSEADDLRRPQPRAVEQLEARAVPQRGWRPAVRPLDQGRRIRPRERPGQ